jgi:hypothetical protein
MRTFALVAGLIALTPCLASASRTAPPSESAALAILAASKQASGGAAWDKIGDGVSVASTTILLTRPS